MAITESVLAVVETGFARLTEAPAPILFDARLIPGLPQRVMPLDELRDLLVRAKFDADVTDALWRQLAQHAREWGQPWLMAAAGIALPGLTAMAAKISGGHRRYAEDVDSELLTAFLDALRHAPLEPPRVWLRLCWAAWRGGVAVVKQPDAEELPTDLAVGSRSPVRPYGHPELLLGRAAVAGVITDKLAQLISDTRFGDILVEQLAAQEGTPASVLRMRRRRAERRVVAALKQGLLGGMAPGAMVALNRDAQARRNGPVRRHANRLTC